MCNLLRSVDLGNQLITSSGTYITQKSGRQLSICSPDLASRLGSLTPFSYTSVLWQLFTNIPLFTITGTKLVTLQERYF
jgi:hypothetical protein